MKLEDKQAKLVHKASKKASSVLDDDNSMIRNSSLKLVENNATQLVGLITFIGSDM